MLRLTKQADYAIILLIRLAEEGKDTAMSARDLAEGVHLPAPIVSKVLKQLTREGLLESLRGVHGGYRLTRPAAEISLAEIITAVEGPIALTECTSSEDPACGINALCSVRLKWERINGLIRGSLEGVSLEEMARPLPHTALFSRAHGDDSVATRPR